MILLSYVRCWFPNISRNRGLGQTIPTAPAMTRNSLLATSVVFSRQSTPSPPSMFRLTLTQGST